MKRHYVKEGKAIKSALKEANGEFSDSSFYGLVDDLLDLFYWNDDDAKTDQSNTVKA